MFRNLIFLICSTLLTVTASSSLLVKRDITLCHRINFNYPCSTISLDDELCHNLSDYHMHQRVMSINTHSSCVYLLSEKNCEGDELRVAPGTASHNNLDKAEKPFGNKAASIIACEL